MSVLIDPNRDFINISFMLVEMKTKNGNTVYHFIRSAEELNDWRTKGYVTAAEIEQKRHEQSLASESGRMRQPGAPVQAQQQPADPERVIQSIETAWTRLSWRDQNSILAKCIKDRSFDNVTYRDLKLKACIKRWNIKDDRGAPIPCAPEMIDQLAPEVANEMLNVFEKLTEPQVQELKN